MFFIFYINRVSMRILCFEVLSLQGGLGGLHGHYWRYSFVCVDVTEKDKWGI